MACVGSQLFGFGLSCAICHRLRDKAGLCSGAFCSSCCLHSGVMRLNSGLLGGCLRFLRCNLGRIFGCLCRKLCFGLGKFSHFCVFLGQSCGLKRGCFSGAVGSRLGAGRCIGCSGGGIVTCSSGLMSCVGNAVGAGQGFMRNLGYAE